jgi:hypothetical protein
MRYRLDPTQAGKNYRFCAHRDERLRVEIIVQLESDSRQAAGCLQTADAEDVRPSSKNSLKSSEEGPFGT